jgi:predicted nucleic acid-binding protein
MIDILRGHLPALQWLKSLGGEEIGLCGIVVMELIQGCQNQGEIRKLEKIY